MPMAQQRLCGLGFLALTLALPGLAGADEGKTPAAAGTASTGAGVDTTASAPPSSVDPHDPYEEPGKRYLFIGARYRGVVIPQFLLNAFVNEGKTIYSNTVGIEMDIRKDGFSLIPALSYSELGTGGYVLFHQKGSPTNVAGNYSVVSSELKTIFASLDILWSARLNRVLDFEYGLGVGLGALFGDLYTNWVYPDANGNIPSQDTNQKFSLCTSEDPSRPGCNKKDHQGTDTARVNNYSEPGWFSGGSKPSMYLWLTPQVGLRIKPAKEFEARLGLGFAVTGPWFGLSGAYGLGPTGKK